MKRRNFFAQTAGAATAIFARPARAATNMKTYEFTQVDVFTSKRLEGNPLAVFPSAEGLNDEQMLAIARELNHSETTFLFPSTGKGDAVVRIFTPTTELPFAGHPTLGTAFVMAKSRPGKSTLLLEEKVGVIPVRIEKKTDGMYLEMRQNDPTFGAKHTEPETLAKVLGIDAAELDSRYTPQVVSTGSAFLILPLRASRTLERLAPDTKLLAAELKKVSARNCYYLVTGESEIEARMFGASFEDPATGSAAGCAAAFLVQYGHQKPDTLFTMRQGRFVKRPSLIYAAASVTDGRVHNVRVGGYVAEVLRGSLTL